MSVRQIRNLVLFLAIISVVFLLGWRVGRQETAGGEKKGAWDLSLMWQVKDRLEEKYLNRVEMDEKKMIYGSVQGMVSALGDPYTVFLPPEENKRTEEDLAGEFGGVGISLGYKDETLAVMSPLPGTPADRAGVEAGDLILSIVDKTNNVDKDTTGISLGEAVQLIRGKVGTEVELKMFREGKEMPFEVVLERSNIVVPSIELEWIEKPVGSVAWIKLYKFTERLYEDWPTIVKEVSGRKNLVGVVLDLRDNPGGFLQGSVMVASDFLKSGVVVKQESSDGRVEVYRVDETKGRLSDEKLVVLVNGGSASASEILAGALRDYQRAKLVGVRTFGKGTVQQPEEFDDGSGLHVTIARWLLPDGKNIHGEGVNPDVEVEDDRETEADEQLEKAVEEVLK